MLFHKKNLHFAFGLHVFCFDASTCNATLWFYILYILLLMCIVSHWKQWHMCFLKTRGEKLQTAFFKTTNKWAFPVFFKCRSLILTQSWHPWSSWCPKGLLPELLFQQWVPALFQMEKIFTLMFFWQCHKRGYMCHPLSSRLLL